MNVKKMLKGAMLGVAIYVLASPVQTRRIQFENDIPRDVPAKYKNIAEYKCGNGIKYEMQQESIVKDIVDKLLSDDGMPGCGGPPIPRPEPSLPIPPIPPGPYLTVEPVIDDAISCRPVDGDSGHSCQLCNPRGLPIGPKGPRIYLDLTDRPELAGIITGNYKKADIESVGGIEGIEGKFKSGGGDGVGI